MTDPSLSSSRRTESGRVAGSNTGRPVGGGTAVGGSGGGVDLATLLGIAAAIGVLAVAILAGGHPGMFFDPPALLIVFGGTAAVSLASFATADIKRAFQGLRLALVGRGPDPRACARQMVMLATAAREAGPEALQAVSAELGREPFLRQALGLVTEGLPAEEIGRVLDDELERAADRHDRAVLVVRRAAEMAPAMGLIGTLLGLVQMLGSLNTPETIGPGMAIALLTTFYGAVLGNMVLAPLAGKLEGLAEADLQVKATIRLAMLSIARQESPRRLEMRLRGLLPRGTRAVSGQG